MKLFLATSSLAVAQGALLLKPKNSASQKVSIARHQSKEQCLAKNKKNAFIQNENFRKNVPESTGSDAEALKAELKNNGGKIHKDGYFEVGCFNEEMRFSASKHDDQGKHRFSNPADVSVVFYNDFVATEDKKDMTPEVCFNFCTQLENYNYFGIYNGRECYCTPYYQKKAGKDETCDQPCDGNKAQTCGGTVKSQVWSMYMCNDMAENHTTATKAQTDRVKSLKDIGTEIGESATELAWFGDVVQTLGGQNGDKIAGNQAQAMRKISGADMRMLRKGVDQARILEKVNPASGTDAQKVAATNGLEKATALSDDLHEKFENWQEAVVEKGTDAESLKKYNSVLKYVDNESFKDWENKDYYTVCDGKDWTYSIQATAQECAQVCDNSLHPKKCMAFQHYSFDSHGLCVLFSDVDAVSTYTCPEDVKPSEPVLNGSNAVCYVKQSESKGFKAETTKNARCVKKGTYEEFKPFALGYFAKKN